MRVFSDTYFPIYVLGFCPYTGKFGLEKTFIFAYLCSVKLSLLVNFGTTFFSVALAKFCASSAKLAALTFSSAFFLQSKVTVYSFGRTKIHLLGINTKSIEFQSNSTRFKLVSGVDIIFEQFKTT